MEIVVDTNVLEVAGCSRGYYKLNNLNAAKFLMHILTESEIQLCLDYNGSILKEYNKNRRIRNNGFLYGWFKQMKNKNKFTFYSSRLKNRIRKKLDELKFHKKDYIFVAVADNSSSEIIVVEIDKDWNEKVRSFLKTIDLFVLNCEDCLKKISN